MKHIQRTLSLEDLFLRVHAGKSDEINTIMLWITSRRSKIHPPTQSLTLTHQDIYKTVNSRRVHFAVIDEYPDVWCRCDAHFPFFSSYEVQILTCFTST
jgi:hypothetical protein